MSMRGTKAKHEEEDRLRRRRERARAQREEQRQARQEPPPDLRIYFGHLDSGGFGIEFETDPAAGPRLVLWTGRGGSYLPDPEAAIVIQQRLHAGAYLAKVGTYVVRWCGKPALLRCKPDGGFQVRDRNSGEVILEVEASLAKTYAEAFTEATRRLLRAIARGHA